MSKFTLIDRAFFLKRTRLFEALDFELLLAISDKLNVVTYDPEEVIFGFNEEAYRMYFIAKGSVEIRDAEQRPLALLNTDDFFGDESIFSEKPRAYAAISKGDSTLLALSRTNLLTIISECPSVAVGLLQTYTTTVPFRTR